VRKGDDGAIGVEDPGSCMAPASSRRRVERHERQTARKRARSVGNGRREMTRPSRSGGRSANGEGCGVVAAAMDRRTRSAALLVVEFDQAIDRSTSFCRV
jgi:hypothetical protein